MKVLQLYSDRRFTGPAEPVMQLCRGLINRGHEVLLAFRGGGEERFHETARRYAVPYTNEFALNRYLGPEDTIHDLIRLPRFLRREKFDIVHTHLRHDQVLGVHAVRRCWHNRPALVHTLHGRDVIKDKALYRLVLKRCDGLLAFTPAFRKAHIDRFGINPRRVGVQPMTVDLERFDPDRSFKDMRRQFGVASAATTIGIVGRFQQYRKMDVFLQAARLVADERDDVRFIVIGKSRQIEETVTKPTEALGLNGIVIRAGYFRDDYADALASLDVFTLLMPGSDGTARAVRQALAIGLPCVVSDYGMLPEIVAHAETGLVVPLEPRALADAWLKLVIDADERARMGAAARVRAAESFSEDRCAETVEGFYKSVRELR